MSIGELPQPERRDYSGEVCAPPLVGRDAELARLDELIGRSHASSQLTVALVRGDMGVGKSRLLDAVASASRALVLTVSGCEWEQSVPFAAAAPLLRSLSEVGAGPARLGSLWEPVRQLEPLQVLEAVRRCMAEAGRTVVLVDDLQWVDRRSVALIHYLMRDAESAGRPLAVVTASRPGPVAHGFGLAVRRLVEDPGRTCQVELRPLAREAASLLVAALRPDLDTQARSALVDRAGGLPFWLKELASAADADRQTGELVAARLAPLRTDSRTLAALLAIWSAPADVGTLAGVLGWRTARCATAAQDVVEAGLVIDSGGALRIAHDAIGGAVAAVMDEGALRTLHAAVAAHYDDGSSDDTVRLRRVLVHRLAAGTPAVDTVRRLLRSRHRRLLGPEDLEECVQIARDQATADEVHDLLADVAELASQIGRPDIALVHWTAIMVESGDALERGRARLRASQCALAAGDPKRARVLLGDAEPDDLDLATRIEWNAHASQVAATSGPASSVPLARALRLSRELSASRGGVDKLQPHERVAQIAALHAEFYHALRTEQVDVMLSTAERIATSAPSLEDRLRGALHAAFAHRLLGRYVEAEEEARAARLAAVREPLPAIAFEAGFLLAATQYSLGRLKEARAAAEELAAMAARAPVVVPSWLSAAWVNALGPEIDVSLLGWPAARDRLSDLVRAESHPHFRLHIRLAHAQWAARLAHPSGDGEVLAELAGAQRDAASAACDRCSAEVNLRAAEAYARIGNLSAASDELRRWESAHSTVSGQNRLWGDRSRALILGHEDPVRAVELMEDVGRLARSMNAGLETVWADLDLGMLLNRIDTAAAVSVLQRAAQEAHEIQAAAEQQRAMQLLRACGVRTWSPGRRSVESADALSDRERAVVEMIRAGASNPEIAEALFISRKTVERHVSNALAKTKSRNRAELAVRADTVLFGESDAGGSGWSRPGDSSTSHPSATPVSENR